ncbi:uncharacterized protein LOC143036180 [Oratosquilla oratoria]|uniref:uncharacterized protein LOC143036180 n=1 Tax=Oratosquilla oratoria TaxID=337810 RepID=UPI003F76ED06
MGEPFTLQELRASKEANSYKPISLLSCIEKTVEKMVLNRLKWKVGPLHPQLYAYRGMARTTECIMDFLGFINGKKAIIVFLDLEKAFELVNPSAMLTYLVEKGIAGNLLAWSVKSRHECTVKTDGLESVSRASCRATKTWNTSPLKEAS